MAIIGSELFLSACFTPLHCTLSGEAPERKHLPQPWPQDPPPTLTFRLGRPFLHFGFFPLRCRSTRTCLQGRRSAGSSTPCDLHPEARARAHWGRLPEILLHSNGGEGRRNDKDDSLCGGTLSAAATRNLFRKKDFIHNGGGCEKRGHILKEVPSCEES